MHGQPPDKNACKVAAWLRGTARDVEISLSFFASARGLQVRFL